MDIQRSVGELSAKIDRLIKDSEQTGRQLDEVRHQVTFVRGAIFVVAALAAVITFLVSNKIHISLGDDSPRSAISPTAK